MSLWTTFLSHSGRGAQKWHQYFPAYERHLARFRAQPVTMLEIGVERGGSLQIWKKYLGPYARIVGIDINPKCAFEEPQISVRIGNQADTAFLQGLVDEFGVFDIILDDGCHIGRHQIATFNYLYPRMSPMGVYIVEDINTSYVDRFEGDYKRPGTFIEFCKDKLDELHVAKGLRMTSFTETTLSINMHESIVVFERGRRDRARSVDVGEPKPRREVSSAPPQSS